MSALIVSQERLLETRSALTGRILGTLLGAGVTVMVSEITSRAGLPVAAQMAVAIAICALIAREHPRYRVAMWTCALVLLTAQPSVPIELVALRRATEVILGAIVGWIFHFAAEAIVDGRTPLLIRSIGRAAADVVLPARGRHRSARAQTKG